MNKFIIFVKCYIETTMFVLTVIFLLLVAIIIQYLQSEEMLSRLPYLQLMIGILLVSWPIFFIERLLYLVFCPYRTWKTYLGALLISLFPPCRLAARRCADQSYIWCVFGWRLVDYSLVITINQRLETRIEKQFLFSGLLLAALMIPFWIIEIFIPKTLIKYYFIYHLLNIGNALIWALFVAEFVILISISHNWTLYLLRHWLELLIILLPMIALVRVIRLVQTSMVLEVLQIPETILLGIPKILNIYRARTFLNRMIRILTLVEFIQLWSKYKNPKKYLVKLKEELAEKELEVILLKRQICEMETEIKSQEND